MKDYIAFKEYIKSMGLVCEFNDETNEYDILTPRVTMSKPPHHDVWYYKGGDLVASVPAHIGRRNLEEAKQLIQVGLDLQNCFAH